MNLLMVATPRPQDLYGPTQEIWPEPILYPRVKPLISWIVNSNYSNRILVVQPKAMEIGRIQLKAQDMDQMEDQALIVQTNYKKAFQTLTILMVV